MDSQDTKRQQGPWDWRVSEGFGKGYEGVEVGNGYCSGEGS